MGDVTAIDYRRTDLRTTVLENPFWITSGLVSAVAGDDKAALLFSFPTAGRIIIVQNVVVENVQVLTTGVAVDVGFGTLATNAVTTGGVITEGTRDGFIKNADTVVTAAAKWGSTSGANASAWLTAHAAGTWASPRVHTGAATSVPTFYAYTSMSGVIVTGTYRVHMLITILPGT